MLEKAYLPPRRGLARWRDVRDWLQRKLYRTYHIRTVAKWLCGIVVLAALLLFAAGKADAQPANSPLVCQAFEVLGVNYYAFKYIGEEFLGQGINEVDAAEVTINAVNTLCPKFAGDLAKFLVQQEFSSTTSTVGVIA